jgi:FkbM family methyltransferase
MRRSFRSIIRKAIGRDPFVLGWTRRLYLALGSGKKNESDYLFDLALSQKDVFVLQVGANDGKRDDFVGAFIRKYKWRGLLLEPLPDVFSALCKNYANKSHVTLLNAALADRDGEMTFYRVRPGPGVPDNCHELGSFYRDVILKHTFIFPEIEKYVVEETIAAVSFPTLIRQQGVQNIDVVVIDTEGYDLEILKMLDFRQFRPKVIIYEHMHLIKEDRVSAAHLLATLGYEIHPLSMGDQDTVAIYSAPGGSVVKAFPVRICS